MTPQDKIAQMLTEDPDLLNEVDIPDSYEEPKESGPMEVEDYIEKLRYFNKDPATNVRSP